MSKIYAAVLLLIFSFNANKALSQCSAGEVEVQIEIRTDAYGSEGYWELVSADSNCGEGTIVSGGNISVGCNGAGQQNQPAGGYLNNQTYTSNNVCLVDGSEYRIAYVDDWGDGGFEFTVRVNGYNVYDFSGSGGFEYFTFNAVEPPAYNMTMIKAHMNSYQPQGNIEVIAEVKNVGTVTITDMMMNYSIDNGATVSQLVTGLSLDNDDQTVITHPTLWTPTSDGQYEIKIWYTDLNGSNPDANPGDDDVDVTINIGPGVPNIVDSYLQTLPIIKEIASNSDQVNMPTDLDFHPVLTRKELWVLNKDLESTGSSTVTISNAGETNQNELWRRDGNAWHFMSLSTGIAFSQNGNFGTSPGVYDANHNGGQAFTGPALWSGDLDVYAQPSGGNGSHLDMLHESPHCQGIANESGNRFWVFDGYNNDIVMYDFHEDHGPGNDDHDDGEVIRYSDVNVQMDAADKVVSHLILDDSQQWLYVVDNENERVIRIDITTGVLGGTPSFGPFETLAMYRHMTNYDWEIVSDTGLIEPSGIEIIDDRLLVSDYATGDIIIYDISEMPAKELKRVKTGADGIMGIKLGPEGKIWYVDFEAETVNRVDWVPDSTLGVSHKTLNQNYHVYPNPSNGQITIVNDGISSAKYSVINALGQSVFQGRLDHGANQIKFDIVKGWYTLKITDTNSGIPVTERLIIQ